MGTIWKAVPDYKKPDKDVIFEGVKWKELYDAIYNTKMVNALCEECQEDKLTCGGVYMSCDEESWHEVTREDIKEIEDDFLRNVFDNHDRIYIKGSS